MEEIGESAEQSWGTIPTVSGGGQLEDFLIEGESMRT